MNHPQMTAMIAAQHDLELHRSAAQARRAKPAPHGIRVVKSTPAAMPAPRPTWSTRLASAFGRTATVAPAPECKLA